MRNILRQKNRLTSGSVGQPKVEDIPVLIPPKAHEALKGDGAYEFVEAIEYPTEGTGGIYTGDYFRSLLDYIKLYPIAGSKDGHESQSEDFFTIGGKIEERSASEGICYLRLIVPAEGWNSSNAALIRSLKAGTPELSLVSEVEPVRGNDGKVYFMKELGRPRNDLVSVGAMDITILNSAEEKVIMGLIEKGLIDMESESDTLVKGGKVCRKYAVALQSTSEKSFAGRVLNAIAERTRHKNSEEAKVMNYEEVLQWIKNAIANNQVTAEKLMADIGFANKLRNASDEKRAKLQSSIAEILELPLETSIEDLLKALEAAFKEIEGVAEAQVELAANELSGGKKLKNADGSEVDNPMYIYALKELHGLRGTKLYNKKESLKSDAVMLGLRSRQADTLLGGKFSGRSAPVVMEV